MSNLRCLGLVVGLAVGLGAVVQQGCAGLSQRECERLGTCDGDGGDPINQLNLSVTTPRLARNSSGVLGLKAEAFQPGLDLAILKVELRQGMTTAVVPVAAGDIQAGSIQAAVDSALLSKFQIGPVDVAVAVGSQRGSGKAFLFTLPKFMAEAVYDYAGAANNGTPLRVGVTKAGPALVWEQYVALDDKRRVREYSLDKQSGKLVAATTIDWLSDNNVDFTFTTLTAPAQVGFGRSDLIVAYQRPAGNFNMLRCQLVNAMPKPCTAPSDTGLAMVTGAALDPSGNLAVLGNGAGVKGFAGMANTAVTINGAATAPAVLVAVDLNNDSAVDLLLVDAAGAATVLVGKEGAQNPDAALTAEVNDRIKEVGALVTMTVADVDGDGLPDLALVGKGSLREVRVAYNLGTGKFEAPRVLATSGGSVASVAAGDIDGDGNTDLVIAASAERRLGLFLNRP